MKSNEKKLCEFELNLFPFIVGGGDAANVIGFFSILELIFFHSTFHILCRSSREEGNGVRLHCVHSRAILIFKLGA